MTVLKLRSEHYLQTPSDKENGLLIKFDILNIFCEHALSGLCYVLLTTSIFTRYPAKAVHYSKITINLCVKPEYNLTKESNFDYLSQ